MSQLVNSRWAIGFHDRGHGHGDYAVLLEETGDLVAKVCTQELAEHLVEVHNTWLTFLGPEHHG